MAAACKSTGSVCSWRPGVSATRGRCLGRAELECFLTRNAFGMLTRRGASGSEAGVLRDDDPTVDGTAVSNADARWAWSHVADSPKPAVGARV